MRAIRVVEVGNYMAGPFCGMQLADLGADVVKIEHSAGGDLSRLLEPIVDGESGNFARLNRGKGEIADYAAALHDPHLGARGFFTELPHTRLGTLRGLGSPLRLGRTPVRIERAGPLLGEHSREVLRELGCDDAAIARLFADGTAA